MELTTVFVLLTAVFVMDAAAQSPYCDVCADHTMCIYQGISDFCDNYFAGGTPDEDIAAILDLHNSLRRTVAQGNELQGSNGPQPVAANMRKMVWDTELAGIAQRWVDQCLLGNDACRDVSRFPVGQDIAVSQSLTYDDTHLANWTLVTVDKWYSQVADFDKDNISPFQSTPLTDSYTQMIWAESYPVGCGFTYWMRISGTNAFNKWYVCNYGPRGNVNGDSMYIAGRPCFQCPDGTVCGDGLCA